MFPVENFAYNGIKTSETIPVPTYHDMKFYREGSLHFNATWRQVATFPHLSALQPKKMVSSSQWARGSGEGLIT